MKKNPVLLFTIVCLLCSVFIQAQHFASIYSPSDTISKHGDGYLARTIQFKLDKAELIQTPNTTLDSIAVFMQKQDSLVIEIGVHGSTHNAAAQCNQLTQARAKAISEYLITKGINPTRMVVKGYGQHQLIYTDAQIQKVKDSETKELMNRRNRRVEFVILRRDFKETK
ncbi:MAG TPA: OmpA family protein [Bacteroidia bacterium]|jgi:outer membrane protein OmpA-like peptidoglycan-associated protein|nr:OmpA family protein [Bacteroidia bacterium]